MFKHHLIILASIAMFFISGCNLPHRPKEDCTKLTTAESCRGNSACKYFTNWREPTKGICALADETRPPCSGLSRASCEFEGLAKEKCAFVETCRPFKDFNKRGFEKNGRHLNGSLHDDRGFNAAGIHKITKDKYDAKAPSGRDIDGFDRRGFNAAGIHKSTNDKYDAKAPHGRDINGLDRRGFNAAGIHKDTNDKYDAKAPAGRDVNGFDRRGFNAAGIHKVTNEKYDAKAPAGRDMNGFDRRGFNAAGIHKDTNDRFDARAPAGRDINGLDRRGFNAAGIHKDTGNKYDAEGPNGRDVNGFNRRGFNAAGIHKDTNDRFDARAPAGRDMNGFDRRGFDARGIHKDTKGKYDRDGRDVNGVNRRGIDNKGFNKAGIFHKPVPTDLAPYVEEFKTWLDGRPTFNGLKVSVDGLRAFPAKIIDLFAPEVVNANIQTLRNHPEIVQPQARNNLRKWIDELPAKKAAHETRASAAHMEAHLKFLASQLAKPADQRIFDNAKLTTFLNNVAAIQAMDFANCYAGQVGDFETAMKPLFVLDIVQNQILSHLELVKSSILNNDLFETAEFAESLLHIKQNRVQNFMPDWNWLHVYHSPVMWLHYFKNNLQKHVVPLMGMELGGLLGIDPDGKADEFISKIKPWIFGSTPKLQATQRKNLLKQFALHYSARKVFEEVKTFVDAQFGADPAIFNKYYAIFGQRAKFYQPNLDDAGVADVVAPYINEDFDGLTDEGVKALTTWMGLLEETPNVAANDVIFLFQAAYDNVGAFDARGDRALKRAYENIPGHRVIYTLDVKNAGDILKVVRKELAQHKNLQIAHLVIMGHGNSDGMLLGSPLHHGNVFGPELSTLGKRDEEQRKFTRALFRELRPLLKKDSTVFFHGCSTGKGNDSFAKWVSEALPKHKIHAPNFNVKPFELLVPQIFTYQAAAADGDPAKQIREFLVN